MIKWGEATFRQGRGQLIKRMKCTYLLGFEGGLVQAASWSGSEKASSYIPLQSALAVITIHPFRIITRY